MTATYARVMIRFGYLNEPFILDLACQKLDLSQEEITEAVGVYSRGKRKGQLRGNLMWLKVENGGWLKDGPGYMNGHVVRPGTTFDYKIVDAWTNETIQITKL